MLLKESYLTNVTGTYLHVTRRSSCSREVAMAAEGAMA